MKKALQVFDRWIGVLCILAIVVFGVAYFHEQQTQRQQNIHSICHMGEAIINGLIDSSNKSPNHPSTAQQQANIDAYKTYVEQQSGSLHCHFSLIPAR